MSEARQRLLLVLAAAAALGSHARGDVQVSRTAKEVRAQNGAVSLAVSLDGRSLLSFRYGAQELVACPSPLYEVVLASKDRKTTRVTSDNCTRGAVAVERGPQSVTMVVSGEWQGECPLDFVLRVTVDDSPLTRWRGQITNRSGLTVLGATYPMVAAVRALSAPAVGASSENLIVNPGFEDGAQHWQSRSPRKGEGDRSLDIAVDKGVAHSGTASARLTFDFPENAQVYSPVQRVEVLPNTPYLLSVYFKTQLQSGTIHVEVQDVRGWKKLCKSTRRVQGTNDWCRATVSFRTTQDTKAVHIGPRHIGSKGDNRPMKGMVWMDDLCMVRDRDWEQFAADDWLVYPLSDGVAMPAPGEKLNGPGRTIKCLYPGASMQLMAYCDPQAGLYLATHDASGQVKRFTCSGDGEALHLAVEHMVPEHAKADLSIAYDTILGGFHGDWYDAGDIYREWAWKQWWCKTRWVNRPDVAEWAKRWPSMVKLDRYKKDTPAESYAVLAAMTRDFRELLGQDVVTFFHGWGKNQWQMGAARREPHAPWGGADVFRKAMADIRAAGGRPFVFIMTDYALEAREGKPEPYNDRATFEREARPFGKLGPDGKVLLRQFRDKHFLARMCPTTDYWQQCMVNKTAQLVDLGVPFVQMDCFPCTLAQPCYNPKHGHPLGYGSWWFEGYRDIVAACRAKGKALNPEFAMATEEICELFMPGLDFYMNRVHSTPRGLYDAYRAARIPLFTYVYHEYLPPYAGEGSGTSLHPAGKKGSGFDYRGIALSLLWGRLFSVRMVGPYDTYKPAPDIVDFYKRAHTAARTYAYDYVVRGRMQRPLPLKTPESDITYWRWWSKPASGNTFRSPAVLCAAWQSPEGSKAALLANITLEPVTVELTLPSAKPPAAAIRNGAREQVTFAGRNATIRMQPLDILMVRYE